MDDQPTPTTDLKEENSEPTTSTFLPLEGKAKWTALLYVGLALAAAVIGGVAIGLLGRSPLANDAPPTVTSAASSGSQTTSQAEELSSQTATQSASPTASGTGNSANTTPPTPTIMDLVLADVKHFEGSPDAPVMIVEFSDFKCPYCARFATETLPRLREVYVNTGKARFSYKHYAILGAESNRAAESSECIADQGKFFEYHDAIYADQVSIRSTLDDNRLIEVATAVGADPTAFKECLDSGRYTAHVIQQSLSVQALGFRGTPGFLINGVALTGAQPYEVFQQIIESQLGNEQELVTPASAPQSLASQAPAAVTPVSSDEEIEGVVVFSDPGKDHQNGKIDYPQDPPPGGKHSDAWQNCGIYDQLIPTESVVHSLEHGAVWIAYQPDLPADQVETLRNLVRQEQQTRGEPLLLLAPKPELEAPIVATAWQAQLQLDNAADERLPLFLSRYQNGPFAPEPGAPCTQGVGQPLN